MKLNDSVVELFDYHYPKGRAPRPDAQQSDYGLIHIGFMVEDFQATYQHLLDKGVRFLGEPVEMRPGVWVAYFHGAEYEVCEMREIQPQRIDDRDYYTNGVNPYETLRASDLCGDERMHLNL